MSDAITPIVMPKWDLAMKEGLLSSWLVEEGAEIALGDEIMEVETDKIANVVEAEEEAGPAYHVLDLDGVKLRYASTSGGGTPALLIHGFGGDLDNWLFQLDALSAACPIYALDLPGHGQSSKTLALADPLLLTKTVRSFMDALSIERAHLIGHSMGALIAGELAFEEPDRAASLTLISPVGLGDDIDGAYIEAFVTAKSRKDMKPAAQKLFHDESLLTRRLVDDLLKYKRLDGVEAFLAALAAKAFPQGRQARSIAFALEDVSTPLLMITGEHDQIVPSRHVDGVARGETLRVAGAGHMPQMEKSAEVNAALTAFLARCDQ